MRCYTDTDEGTERRLCKEGMIMILMVKFKQYLKGKESSTDDE